ncbi:MULTISPECIES: RNA polymerase sigma factor [Paenibacillus]|uniref:RNA polymerase sigma factor n=1 Tax=Paenibacillus campinasensis TaxID=66347 RepID=A0A268F0L3_9BACL|nr:MULTISPECIES: RNA polymerase sigma factor [Paenibacillus]MUG65601.1 sigma-70 family RNA polymerase sigma factor [Paenibacillus campinasensis]PAD78873.1 RNA polymerase subunit sigma-24 [Paenibacillus campinasensis]PAK53850.1 RNA polymerase subunit sigma-24 [Paenibacillus sp. 7541]
MEQWFYLLQSPLDELDTKIQELVFRSFYQFVYRDILFMVRDHSLAEDIIQEAFIKAITKGPQMRSCANIPAWIKQVTRNTALDHLRKLKRDRQILVESFVHRGDTAFEEISVTSEVEVRERDKLLYQAMAELKSDYRQVLLLFYIEGRPYRDICKELGMSEPVLTQRLARARKKLLQHFLRKWADNHE